MKIIKEGILMNQGEQPNMQPSMNQAGMQANQSLNHGGHELFDTHEVLTGIIDMLDHYTMFDQHIQDPALKDMLQRQTNYITQTYNTIVDAFKTGQDPKVPTQEYQMQQSNDVVYGMQPGQPTKPITSMNEVNDEKISTYMLCHAKAIPPTLATAAAEINNPVLRRVVADSIPNFIELSYEIFLYQNKHGYYQVPQLGQQDMMSLLNSFAPAQQPPNGQIH